MAHHDDPIVQLEQLGKQFMDTIGKAFAKELMAIAQKRRAELRLGRAVTKVDKSIDKLDQEEQSIWDTAKTNGEAPDVDRLRKIQEERSLLKRERFEFNSKLRELQTPDRITAQLRSKVAESVEVEKLKTELASDQLGLEQRLTQAQKELDALSQPVVPKPPDLGPGDQSPAKFRDDVPLTNLQKTRLDDLTKRENRFKSNIKDIDDKLHQNRFERMKALHPEPPAQGPDTERLRELQEQRSVLLNSKAQTKGEIDKLHQERSQLLKGRSPDKVLEDVEASQNRLAKLNTKKLGVVENTNLEIQNLDGQLNRINGRLKELEQQQDLLNQVPKTEWTQDDHAAMLDMQREHENLTNQKEYTAERLSKEKEEFERLKENSEELDGVLERLDDIDDELMGLTQDGNSIHGEVGEVGEDHHQRMDELVKEREELRKQLPDLRKNMEKRDTSVEPKVKKPVGVGQDPSDQMPQVQMPPLPEVPGQKQTVGQVGPTTTGDLRQQSQVPEVPRTPEGPENEFRRKGPKVEPVEQQLSPAELELIETQLQKETLSRIPEDQRTTKEKQDLEALTKKEAALLEEHPELAEVQGQEVPQQTKAKSLKGPENVDEERDLGLGEDVGDETLLGLDEDSTSLRQGSLQTEDIGGEKPSLAPPKPEGPPKQGVGSGQIRVKGSSPGRISLKGLDLATDQEIETPSQPKVRPFRSKSVGWELEKRGEGIQRPEARQSLNLGKGLKAVGGLKK